jgi:hypothetical protein
MTDDDGTLRDRAREAIRAGSLPNRLPDKVWGGPATAVACTVCGEPLGDGVEYELVFTDDDHRAEHSCCVHPPCLQAFERVVKGPCAADTTGRLDAN